MKDDERKEYEQNKKEIVLHIKEKQQLESKINEIIGDKEHIESKYDKMILEMALQVNKIEDFKSIIHSLKEKKTTEENQKNA